MPFFFLIGDFQCNSLLDAIRSEPTESAVDGDRFLNNTFYLRFESGRFTSFEKSFGLRQFEKSFGLRQFEKSFGLRQFEKSFGLRQFEKSFGLRQFEEWLNCKIIAGLREATTDLSRPIRKQNLYNDISEKIFHMQIEK